MPTTTRDVPPEAQQRQGREELKRWREERIAALASRRRAYRVLQGDLSSPRAPRRAPLPVEAQRAERDEAARAPAPAPAPARFPPLEAPVFAAELRSSEGAEVSPAGDGVARALPLDEAGDAAPPPMPASAPAAADGGGEKLYDHFIVVGLPSRLVEHPDVAIGARYSPKVLHHLSSTDEFLGAEAIADFCLPVGAAVRGAARASDRGEPRSPGALNGDRDVTEVIFVLSGGGRDGSRVQYGICAHTTRFYEAVDKGRAGYDLVEADVCYCLITRYPFVALHFQVLRAAIAAEVAASRAARAVGRGDDDHRRHRGRRYAAANLTLRDYAALPVPPPGGRVVFRCARADPPSAVEWTRPPGRGKNSSRRRRDAAPGDEATALAREWSVPVMLSKLTLENVLLVLGCALVELQIVFVSQDLQTLSASALALVSLLRPLRWAGPLISTLPSELYEYLDSPVPLILGVVSLPLHFEQGPDMVLVFVCGRAGNDRSGDTSNLSLSRSDHGRLA